MASCVLVGGLSCFFFNDTATAAIYTLSLHDALPIWVDRPRRVRRRAGAGAEHGRERRGASLGRRERRRGARSEEHTSELQSQSNLVCRLLLEKKKQYNNQRPACHPLSPRLSAINTRH